MTTKKSKLIIAQHDYEILNAYIKGFRTIKEFDKKNAASLHEELKKAMIVKNEELPGDVVRLNSRVMVKEDNKQTFELVLVLPDKADIKQKRISVFAPIGTALIGFREGEKIKWNVPAGSKTFTILKVYNQKA